MRTPRIGRLYNSVSTWCSEMMRIPAKQTSENTTRADGRYRRRRSGTRQTASTTDDEPDRANRGDGDRLILPADLVPALVAGGPAAEVGHQLTEVGGPRQCHHGEERGGQEPERRPDVTARPARSPGPLAQPRVQARRRREAIPEHPQPVGVHPAADHWSHGIGTGPPRSADCDVHRHVSRDVITSPPRRATSISCARCRRRMVRRRPRDGGSGRGAGTGRTSRR